MLQGGDMEMKRKIRWMIDILMTLVLFFLMGYHFWGETAHEWAGAGMFALCIAHQILNRGWYQSLTRGKYSAVRILMLAVNMLTLAVMVMLMYSGITMSRHVFAFFPEMGSMAAARRLHLLGSYWGFLLMSLHLGLHWGMVWNVLERKTGRQKGYLCFAGSLLVAAYGAYVFIKRDFLTYLLLKSEFVFLDYSESKVLFYLDYLALMGLCIFVTHYGSKLLRNKLCHGSRRTSKIA